MDEKLILNNGTEMAGHLLETETRLFLYVYGKTLTELFDLLIVPDNVSSISWERYGQTGEAIRYTTLMSISVEPKGMVCASLIK